VEFSIAAISIIVFFSCVYIITLWLDNKGIDYPPPHYCAVRMYSKYRLQITVLVGEGDGAEIKSSGWFEYKSRVRVDRAKSDMEKALVFALDSLSLREYSIKVQGYTESLSWETIDVEGGCNE